MHSINQPEKVRSKRTIFTEAFAYVTELTKGLFAMLAEHKELLLRTVQNSNHQIYCLEYLTYRMRKELKL